MNSQIRFSTRFQSVALTLLAAAGLPSSVLAGAKDKTLDVYWVDSEGGGPTLIVTPNAETVRRDHGNPRGSTAGPVLARANPAGTDKREWVR